MANSKKLCIGMAVYDDFDGVYFTVQSLRLHHEIVRSSAVEIIVLDNNHNSDQGKATRDFLHSWVPNARYVPYGGWTGTAIRTLLFDLAVADIVLCVDAHVLIEPGSIDRLLRFFQEHPGCQDLIQGPMLHDDLGQLSTHMEPVWKDRTCGVWGCDSRGTNVNAPAFEIPMQYLGAFACRREAWLGFNHAFEGFGGEEGYLHEKFRQVGHRTLCLPGLRWLHRFSRPTGAPFSIRLQDKLRNYLIGHGELGLDTTPVLEHYSNYLPGEEVRQIAAEADRLLCYPPVRHVPIIVHGGLVSGDEMQQPVESQKPAVRVQAQRSAACAQLGMATGELRQCLSCRGRVDVKLFRCELHDRCTISRSVGGAACCGTCTDYVPAIEISSPHSTIA